MKKIILFLVLGVFLVSACANQNTQAPENLVGGGSEVPGQKQPIIEEPATKDTEVSGINVKEFKITAKQFSFTPSTIEVNKGDKVRLIVTSMDVPHGIAIKEYGINERLEVGKPVTIEFTADKEGTFTAYCSVFCGSGHSGMKGNLIVK
ncbi:cupredoxin domain-containing protein [Candidatus Woesearchaeota archaeon]|nr:cupredoxin domain-containing protein [Candidatus Woesearchaeota archaeon]